MQTRFDVFTKKHFWKNVSGTRDPPPFMANTNWKFPYFLFWRLTLVLVSALGLLHSFWWHWHWSWKISVSRIFWVSVPIKVLSPSRISWTKDNWISFVLPVFFLCLFLLLHFYHLLGEPYSPLLPFQTCAANTLWWPNRQTYNNHLFFSLEFQAFNFLAKSPQWEKITYKNPILAGWLFWPW